MGAKNDLFLVRWEVGITSGARVEEGGKNGQKGGIPPDVRLPF